MGNAALEGRPGVLDVTIGWRGFRETNTVVYDPEVITVQEMIRILKGHRTYRGTLEKP
ncbi:MAG: hypothetical protein JSV00_02415 [bacterium]|nr:MAG: hypothetical protein JSV00_02415 [bacterium]